MSFEVRLYFPLRAACVVMTLMLPVAVSAGGVADLLDKGPRLGERIPESFELPDQTGKAQSLASLAGGRGLVLLFYRSMEMCPSCEYQMRRWSKQAATLRALGYGLATITTDSVESLARVARRGTSIALLADPQAKAITAFGLRDPQYPPGSPWYGTPHPIVIVVDRAGTVQRRYSSKLFRDRPDIDAIVAQLRAAGS